MSFPWSDLMHETISWQVRASGSDGHGQPTFGSATSLRCRVSHRPRVVRTAIGEEVVSTATVYVEGDPGIDALDRITLEDGTTPVILVAKTHTDDIGSKHQELML